MAKVKRYKVTYQIIDWLDENYGSQLKPYTNQRTLKKQVEDIANEINDPQKRLLNFVPHLLTTKNSPKGNNFNDIIDSNNKDWSSELITKIKNAKSELELKVIRNEINTDTAHPGGGKSYEDEYINLVTTELKDRTDEIQEIFNDALNYAKRWIPTKNHPTFDFSDPEVQGINEETRKKIENIVNNKERDYEYLTEQEARRKEYSERQ